MAMVAVQYFRNNWALITLSPQNNIFGILDSAINYSIFKDNKIFISHILLLLPPIRAAEIVEYVRKAPSTNLPPRGQKGPLYQFFLLQT